MKLETGEVFRLNTGCIQIISGKNVDEDGKERYNVQFIYIDISLNIRMTEDEIMRLIGTTGQDFLV